MDGGSGVTYERLDWVAPMTLGMTLSERMLMAIVTAVEPVDIEGWRVDHQVLAITSGRETRR